MNAQQLDLVPDQILHEPGTQRLRHWLTAHGLRMSLAELDAERRRRRPGPTTTRGRNTDD